jgi:hypothetical protein
MTWLGVLILLMLGYLGWAIFLALIVLLFGD